MRTRTLPLYALIEVDSDPVVLVGVNSRGNWALAKLRGDVTLYVQGVDVPCAHFKRSYLQARGSSRDDELMVQLSRYRRGDMALAQVEFQERFGKSDSGNYYLSGYELWIVRFVPLDNAVVVKELGFALA